MIYVNTAYMVSRNSYTSLIRINKFKFHDYSLKEIYVLNRVGLTMYKQLYQLNKTPNCYQNSRVRHTNINIC